MKMFAGAVGALLLLFGVVVTYLQYGDLRPHAEWAAAEFLERELRIAGRFEVDLWPAPRILLEKVSLANAPWGSEAPMLQAGRLSARVDAWSLISGPIRLRDVQAEGVEVLIERGPGGRSNWSFADSGESATPARDAPGSMFESITGPELPAVVERAKAVRVGVAVRSPGDPARRLAVHALNVTLDETGRQNIDVDGVVTNVPLKLEGQVARGGGHEVDLVLTGTLGSLSLDVRGLLGERTEIVAQLGADDLAELLHRLDVDLPLAGRLEVKGRLTGGRDGFRIEADTLTGPVHAHWRLFGSDGIVTFRTRVADLAALGTLFDVAGLPSGELRFGGRVATAGEAVELHEGAAVVGDTAARMDLRFTAEEASGRIQATGRRLSDLDPDLPDLPFRLALQGVRRGDRVELDDVALEVGDTDLAGAVALTMREPLELTGRLQSRRMDLAQLFAGAGQRNGEPGPPEEGEPAFVFAPAPLPVERLLEAEIDLELRVAELIQDGLQLADLSLSGRVHDRELQSGLTFRAPAGGTVRGTLMLRARETPARLEIRAEANDLRLNLMSGAQTEPRQIPPVGLSVDLESEGRSPRELAAAASGRVLFTQGPGRIVSGAAVPWLSGDLLTQLFEALNPFRRQEPYSELECGVLLVELKDGQGELPVVLFQNGRLRVVGKGAVDLRTEQLQVEFNTQPRKGIGVGADMFVTPFVMLGGTLASPSIEMNKRAVLLRGGAAFLSGGLTILGKSLIDRASGQRDSCAGALEAARAASRTDSR